MYSFRKTALLPCAQDQEILGAKHKQGEVEGDHNNLAGVMLHYSDGGLSYKGPVRHLTFWIQVIPWTKHNYEALTINRRLTLH